AAMTAHGRNDERNSAQRFHARHNAPDNLIDPIDSARSACDRHPCAGLNGAGDFRTRELLCNRGGWIGDFGDVEILPNARPPRELATFEHRKSGEIRHCPPPGWYYDATSIAGP